MLFPNKQTNPLRNMNNIVVTKENQDSEQDKF